MWDRYDRSVSNKIGDPAGACFSCRIFVCESRAGSNPSYGSGYKGLNGIVMSIITFLIFSFSIVTAAGQNADPFFARRNRMVSSQIAQRGITDDKILEAFRAVERHKFVPAEYIPYAYNDSPLPIAEGQTISQPYIVAFMTNALDLKRSDKVLEIGTGSGYQAAILGELCDSVFTIELF